MWIFTVAVFIIAPNGGQPKCPQLGLDIVWVNRQQTMVQPYHGTLLSNKGTIDTCSDTGESQNDCAKWKRPDTK